MLEEAGSVASEEGEHGDDEGGHQAQEREDGEAPHGDGGREALVDSAVGRVVCLIKTVVDVLL